MKTPKYATLGMMAAAVVAATVIAPNVGTTGALWSADLVIDLGAATQVTPPIPKPEPPTTPGDVGGQLLMPTGGSQHATWTFDTSGLFGRTCFQLEIPEWWFDSLTPNAEGVSGLAAYRLIAHPAGTAVGTHASGRLTTPPGSVMFGGTGTWSGAESSDANGRLCVAKSTADAQPGDLVSGDSFHLSAALLRPQHSGGTYLIDPAEVLVRFDGFDETVSLWFPPVQHENQNVPVVWDPRDPYSYVRPMQSDGEHYPGPFPGWRETSGLAEANS